MTIWGIRLRKLNLQFSVSGDEDVDSRGNDDLTDSEEDDEDLNMAQCTQKGENPEKTSQKLSFKINSDLCIR